MPFDVNVRSLDAVLEVVGGAARPNGGIAIDTWHMSKLGIAPDDLRRIPLEYMSWIELSDGQFADMDDPIDEVINHRNLPGEGEFDVRGYIEVCQDHGYAGPWGVEVLSEELRNNPIDVIFRRAYEATAAQFEPRGAPRERSERKSKELDRDRLVWMYEQMLRIREFEERVKRTFVEHPGVIRGHTHLADGAEASIVGSIATLGPDDQFFATYRCHGYPLVRGTDPKAMMAEIYGRKDGLCKGIGGSMHLCRPLERLPRHVGDRRRRHPARDRRGLGGADPQAGPGRPVLLRRRRLQAGRVLRVAEHRLALEAPDRLRDGEQRLQRPHAHRAGGRQPRQRRGPLRQGEGVQHARRHDRRPRPGRGATRRSAPRSRAPARATGRRSSSRRCTASRRTATSSPRPACRCTSPSTRRSRSSAHPRSTRPR